MTLDQLNALDHAAFVAQLGGIFEHSPWVAERVFGQRPFATVAALHASMCNAVAAASAAEQLALIRAHPQLAHISHHPSAADTDPLAVTGRTPSGRLDVVSATPAPSFGPCAPPQRRLGALATKCGEKRGLTGKAAIRNELTAASLSEQRGAGLDQCSPAEFARLRELNDAYQQRFGFPFILAVRGHGRDSIIANMAQRLSNSPEHEHAQALRQIAQIADLRLADLVND